MVIIYDMQQQQRTELASLLFTIKEYITQRKVEGIVDEKQACPDYGETGIPSVCVLNTEYIYLSVMENYIYFTFSLVSINPLLFNYCCESTDRTKLSKLLTY
jgi:hypothetical protein